MKLNKTLIIQGCCKAKNIKHVNKYLHTWDYSIFYHKIEYHKYYKISAFYSIVIYTDSEQIKNGFLAMIKQLEDM